MPEVKSDTLRIFCICGQKMKVSEKMYGLPGKCVACRQKIRIPRRDEVPEGAVEIHLKDYPELLRGKPKGPALTDEEREANRALASAHAAIADGAGESTPNTELDLLDSPPLNESTKPPPVEPKKRSVASVPLDVLPPLQVLCSLNFKLSRQLDTLQLNNHEDEVRLAELEGHVSRVRKLRNRLDDHLHQVLMETAIELSNTQEKLAQRRLRARVGEISWEEFRDEIYRLRVRRDRLERRQQNLRGWLAVKDPYLAGGLLDLSVDSIPNENSAVTLPSEPEEESASLAALTAGLRDAFEERARVRQRLSEVQRMGEGGGREMEELRREVGQQRVLARARVAYYQDRLQQMKKDYTSDVETANAALGVARDKLRVDGISREEYDAVEREALRSKRDIARARAVISRALGANSAVDVPSPKGTFLERLGVSGGDSIGTDAIAGYAAVVLLCASIFAPTVGTKSLLSTAMDFVSTDSAVIWLFVAPLALAGIAGLAVSIHRSTLRGALYLAGGFLGFVAGAYLVNEGSYGLGSLASRFRTVSPWYLQPGIVLFFLGCTAMSVAGALALWPMRKHRVWPVAVAVAAVLAMAVIFTDAFGALRPEPKTAVTLTSDTPGAGVIRVTNTGGRAARLLSRAADSRDGFRFLVERRVGPTSFAPTTGRGPLFEARTPNEHGELFKVEAGGVQELPFVLDPGEYRVSLEPRAPGQPIETQFTIEGPPPSATPSQPQLPAAPAPVPADATATDPAVAAGETGQPDAAAAGGESEPGAEDFAAEPEEAAAGPEVELNGIASVGESPIFTLDVYHTDGLDQRLSIPLGGTVWGEWIIEEYNPEERTVTLSKDGRFLILRRGTPVTLTP